MLHQASNLVISSIARVLPLALLGAMLAGCSSNQAATRAIGHMSRDRGLFQPYTSDVKLQESPQLAFLALYSVLDEQQAQFMEWDADARVVTWRATGGSYAPIPQEAPVTGFDPGGKVHVLNWEGHVFGCAHVVESGYGSIVYISTRGRDLGMGEPVLSDGSYERHLMHLVQTRSHDLRLGAVSAPEIPPRNKGRLMATGNMAKLIHDYYDERPLATPAVIESTISPDQRSYPPDQVWSACLDVLCQAGIVVNVDNGQRTIVAAYSQLAPNNLESKDKTKPSSTSRIDALIVVHVAPDGASNSALYIGYFDKELKVRDLPRSPSSRPSNEAIAEIAGMEPLESGSAVLCADLSQAIQMQTAYTRWGSKLKRRAESAQ